MAGLNEAIKLATEKGGYKPYEGINHDTRLDADVMNPLFWEALWKGIAIQETGTFDESTVKKAARQSYNEYMDANWKGNTDKFWKELFRWIILQHNSPGSLLISR